MRSIRRRLTWWLLGGLILVWTAAAVGVYLAVRQSLIKSIDAKLAVDARTVRFVAKSNGSSDGRSRPTRFQDRMTDYRDANGEAFYQVWKPDGSLFEKSESLGERELPISAAGSSGDVFGTVQVGEGVEVRTLGFRISIGPGKGKGKGKGRSSNSYRVVLGRDLGSARQTLNSLLSGLVLVGLIAGIGTAALIGVALRNGLQPLVVLTRQTRDVDAASLSARFEAQGVPVELEPVYASLNSLLERLERGFDRERRFSADLAHEIRTPVSELKMLSEVALKWPEEAGADTYQQGLEIAKRLEAIIESLLTLARLESGEAKLRMEPVALKHLVEECWAGWSAQAESRALKVELPGDDEPSWMTDPGVLRLIVNNLFSNAVEYTPEQGKIVVGVSADGIKVANEAPDLEEEQVDRLFERFWRGDASREATDHSGLGLALARQGAKALGMELRASLSHGVLTFALKKV